MALCVIIEDFRQQDILRRAKDISPAGYDDQNRLATQNKKSRLKLLSTF